MPVDSHRVQHLFLEIVELPADQRPAALDRACGADNDLRQRVAALLAAHDQPGSFLELPSAAALSLPLGEGRGEGTPTSDQPSCEGPGTQIGPYKLLQKFGEGGMGAVYVAEQTEPVKRRVALKVIKPGMDTAQVIARFEAERQALAIMDHTNIAKVLDAGTTETGRPYFVMELVKGVPITKYCDELNLPIRERLALFVPVCQAIQHAHQKGIIHRDVKPTNVLIAMQDGRPVPKVIDFGVAKALHQRLTDRTMMTEFGAVVGTLEYMAPEQAELSALDIDTRADVYGLGVLLYELLTGTTPLDRKRLRSAALDEMLRIIREDEPPKPSTRLTASENLASLAAHRRTEPRKLGAEVRGELDWIVMKCLEKDRTRRYETANGLARDVERYLSDAPVEACPPSAGYRLKKVLRRNKGPALAAAVVLVTLVVGIIGTTWGLIRAEKSRQLAEAARERETARAESEARERRRAESAEATALANERQAATERDRAEQETRVAQAVKDFLQNGLLHQADVYFQGDVLLRSGGASTDIKENPTVRELLDRAAAALTPEKIETQFPNMPLVQAGILRTIGDTYRMLGEYGPASAHLERSRDLYIAERGPDHPDTLITLSTLAFVYTAAGKFSDGAKLYEQVRDKQIKKLGPDHPDTLTTMHDLAWTYRDERKFPQAIQLFEHVRDRRIATLGSDHPDTLTALQNLAFAYMQSGRLAEALALFEHVRDRRMEKLGPEHPDTLATLGSIARTYSATGRASDAIQLFEQVRDKQIAKLGPNHRATLLTSNDLGSAYRRAGRLSQAIQLLEQVYDKNLTKFGPDYPNTWITRSNLASAYQAAGRLPEAIQLFEEVVRSARRVLGSTHSSTILHTTNWCSALDQARQFGKSVEVRRELLAVQREQFPATDPRLATALAGLGSCLLKIDQSMEAEALLKECLTIREQAAPDEWLTFNAKSVLGAALLHQKKYAEAEPFLLAGYEGTEARKERIPATVRALRVKESLQRLIDLYTAWDKPDQAAKWRKLLDDHKAAANPIPASIQNP